MKTPYVQNDFCYVLNNFGVASNPIFLTKADCEDFQLRVEKHLSELCSVIAYSFNNYEYQVVVNIHDREIFESFYRTKHADRVILKHEIPESTYILSQEMANLQSGYAKHFNYKYGRKGAVFARRFSKTLIESEAELRFYVDAANQFTPFEVYDWKWQFRRRKMEGLGYLELIKESSLAAYRKKFDTIISSFIKVETFILQGRFKIPDKLI